jgi:hypothetical protein
VKTHVSFLSENVIIFFDMAKQEQYPFLVQPEVGEDRALINPMMAVMDCSWLHHNTTVYQGKAGSVPSYRKGQAMPSL